MTKDTAMWICDFIIRNYDYVDQEAWFAFQDVMLDAVAHDANRGGYAKSLTERFPQFFGFKTKE